MNEVIYDESLDEKWDVGTYGASAESVEIAEVSPELEAQFDKASAMTLISIRLQDDLINELKEIASIYKIGYQPMIRQLLHRFVVAERKILVARNQAMQIQVENDTQPQLAAKNCA
ncbi:hypothetical protein [Rheinheimera faecalis]